MTREEKKKELIALFATGAMPIGELIDACFAFADANPHWISVEDELPKDFKIVKDGFFAGKYEETDIVMVALDDGDFGFARYVHDFPDAEDGEGWYWVGESTLSGVTLAEGEVTHWMPLPQLPKKGGKQ